MNHASMLSATAQLSKNIYVIMGRMKQYSSYSKMCACLAHKVRLQI